ncbi:MAG: hypothetical protein WDA71_10235 [Actinomycetota bacterium]
MGLAPTESKPGDPNRGQWFVFSLAPGETGRTKVRMVNPGRAGQTVKMYGADLNFAADGTPSVNDGAQRDVGLWVAFEQASVWVPAMSAQEVPFSVTVPPGAAPGDHIGVIVAESAPQGSEIQVIKRTAVRLYVTVPGVAAKGFRITKVKGSLAPGIWPRKATVSVTVRNTGAVRLALRVEVNGVRAKGPAVLLARSSEVYVARVSIPWYGGPLRWRVRAWEIAGPAARASKSAFAIPWALLIIVVAVSGILGGVWHRARKRERSRQRAALASLAGSLGRAPVPEGTARRGVSATGETPVWPPTPGVSESGRPRDWLAEASERARAAAEVGRTKDGGTKVGGARVAKPSVREAESRKAQPVPSEGERRKGRKRR